VGAEMGAFAATPDPILTLDGSAEIVHASSAVNTPASGVATSSIATSESAFNRAMSSAIATAEASPP